jgi:hypothetical protein
MKLGGIVDIDETFTAKLKIGINGIIKKKKT